MQAASSTLTTISLLLLLLITPASAGKSAGFLASTRAKSASAHLRKSEARLRRSFSQLASALQARLGDTATLDEVQLPIFVADARDLLSQEANRLYSSDGADLLERFAHRAPAYVFVMPVSAYRAADEDLLGHASELSGGAVGHEVTDQRVVRTAGNGKSFTKSVHCEDGNCKTTQSRGSSADGNAMAFDTFHDKAADNGMAFGGFPDISRSIHDAAARIAREMKAIQSENGKGALDNTMRSIFKQGAEAKSQGTGAKSRSHGTGAKSLSHSSSSSQSMSSETVLDHGKLVTRTKTCKDGKCKTSVTKKHVGNVDDSAGDSQPLFSGPTSIEDDFDDFDRDILADFPSMVPARSPSHMFGAVEPVRLGPLL